MEVLKTYFPSAKFLIVVRDIRDVALSWSKKWGKNMLLTAHKWDKRMQVDVLDDVHFVKFEDLVTSPERITKDICLFLGVAWSSRMLSHHIYQDKILDGKINYGKELIAENKEKWKLRMKPARLKRIEEIAFDSLTQFGYKISLANSKRELSKIEKIIGVIQDVLATLFIGNRFSEKNSIFSRLKFTFDQVRYRIGY